MNRWTHTENATCVQYKLLDKHGYRNEHLFPIVWERLWRLISSTEYEGFMAWLKSITTGNMFQKNTTGNLLMVLLIEKIFIFFVEELVFSCFVAVIDSSSLFCIIINNVGVISFFVSFLKKRTSSTDFDRFSYLICLACYLKICPPLIVVSLSRL